MAKINKNTDEYNSGFWAGVNWKTKKLKEEGNLFQQIHDLISTDISRIWDEQGKGQDGMYSLDPEERLNLNVTQRGDGIIERVFRNKVEEVIWTKGEDGRVQMQPTGKKEIIEADLVFLAMGFVHPVQEGLIKSSNLATDNRKNIIVDKSFKSSASNVFACGDATTGASLVVKAMAAGRDTAKAIDSYLSSII